MIILTATPTFNEVHNEVELSLIKDWWQIQTIKFNPRQVEHPKSLL